MTYRSFKEGEKGVEKIPFVNLTGKPLKLQCDTAMLPGCLSFSVVPSVVVVILVVVLVGISVDLLVHSVVVFFASTETCVNVGVTSFLGVVATVLEHNTLSVA